MKILYFFKEDNTNMTQWQRVHIFNELQYHNVDIDVFNPSKYETISKANEFLIKILRYRCNDYDLFMNCCGSDLLYPETMRILKDISIPKLLICFDNLHAPHMHKNIASFFDLVWLTSSETKFMFQKWGCNTIFLPYAANPYLFQNMYCENIPKIGFIGTPYGTRALKINELLKHCIPCNIYGNNVTREKYISDFSYIWESLRSFKELFSFSIGRKVLLGKLISKMKEEVMLCEDSEYLTICDSVSFKEMNKLYSNLSLNLNILELRNTYLLKNPVFKLHLRTFEIPMCAGIQITTFNNELSSYFEEDIEIIFYRELEELVDKCKFYLDERNDRIRGIIRNNSRRRATLEHTWWNRFSVVFQVLGVK